MISRCKGILTFNSGVGRHPFIADPSPLYPFCGLPYTCVSFHSCHVSRVTHVLCSWFKKRFFRIVTKKVLPLLLLSPLLSSPPFYCTLPTLFTSMEKHASDRLVFIKLGGSLITDKTRPETVREEVMLRIARCVPRAVQQLTAYMDSLSTTAVSSSQASARQRRIRT